MKLNMKFLIVVFCLTCLNVGLCKKIYRAGVYTEPQKEFDANVYDVIIQEAAKKDIDILILSPPKVSILDEALEKSSFRPENYDEIVSAISVSAKKAGLYVVANLYNKDVTGLVQTNVVFDRQGAVVSTYRKAVYDIANRTSEVGSFTSNFGVLFAVLTEEDLVLHNIGSLKNVHNFIVLGSSNVDTGFLRTPELLSSWVHTTKANFITENNIYGSNTKKAGSKLLIADLNKDEADFVNVPQVNTADLEKSYDFKKYTIKPVDIEASTLGYEETVCQDKTCCNFFVKSRFAGSTKNNFNYGLAVLNGLQSSGQHNIGVQNCAVFAYTGLYQHAFDFGSSQNNSAIKFNRIIISQNMTDTNVAILPIVVAHKAITENQFDFNTKIINGNTRVTVEIEDIDKLSMFGLFGRNYTKDFINAENSGSNNAAWDIYNYINSNRILECFDYLWITIRVLLFFVSIYILEMM